ncbi:MAG: RHS repeat-associated core domain-containing protein [Reichenbachiella sp.]|uniref:RHS repeat-associated core domain-containing protein n=1 Tax=Reichenbachiella sp. TaxID=2184521 RepID=UPI00296682AA|nr:RHS repeat-associated core domain-containing protein [Reichenbachiella sp.]MDW3210922.1 RHS repeat-associated core domain-containing protein [Reichenbachiella sp.]
MKGLIVYQGFLDYLVFDSNYKVDSTRTGFQQISTVAEERGENGDHEKLSHQLTFDQPGYVYIYLSNEEDTPMDVFFDDFKVTQTHSPVVQKDDYYPFGLSFNSYTRAAITDQNFKFNAGSELESMTDWYSTPFRKYDPSLGRFHGVDALAFLYPSLTPSQFGLNNPIMGNDPTGLKTDPVDEARSGSGCGSCFMPELNYGYGFGGWADQVMADVERFFAADEDEEGDENNEETEYDQEGGYVFEGEGGADPTQTTSKEASAIDAEGLFELIGGGGMGKFESGLLAIAESLSKVADLIGVDLSDDKSGSERPNDYSSYEENIEMKIVDKDSTVLPGTTSGGLGEVWRVRTHYQNGFGHKKTTREYIEHTNRNLTK